MNAEIIDVIIKMVAINFFNFICFFKISNQKFKLLKIVVGSVIISVLYAIEKTYISDEIFVLIISTYIMQIIILWKFSKNRNAIVVCNFISNTVVYVLYSISLIIVIILKIIFKIEFDVKYQTIDLVVALGLETIFMRYIIKLKRIRNGLSFLNDSIGSEYFSLIIMLISSIVIFAYCILVNSENEFSWNILGIFLMLSIIMFIIIKKIITLYYKQKLLVKNIEEYKTEIAVKDAKIKELSDEKYKISKLNHEFYNRQKSLVHKVEKMNIETSTESDIIKQINNLTKEYADKAQEIKTLDKLPITGITEIDDMFKYMQSECKDKNIQFNLQVNGNIYYMINNKISEKKLVTLIGDHLRDAITAIDFSNNSFKSILAVLGENNGIYEFCVYDTGIEFEIDTLLRLGLEPSTTHKEAGGTGIGFMTTFETMKETKASLIINEMHEMTNTDYTKSITIRFDGKNEYRIKSYRSDEIIRKQKNNRIIIENNNTDVPQSGTKKRA